MLGELTTSSSDAIAEYRRRKRAYVEQTFRQDEREYALSQDWILVRENAQSLRFQKPRGIDEQLENEFWRLLYEFGYPTLSVGRNFQITIASKEEGDVTKQIDVFAYDHETIIVAECKACDKRTKRSLSKDIGEFASLQKPISQTLRKHFGGKFDQKVIWIFVTKNVDWIENDRIKAREQNINIITEREMFYYKEIAKRIGHAARYQFHAEFLAKAKVAALEHETFAIRTKIGPFKVFSFFAPARKILPISFINHRDLRDPTATPSYQRLIQKPRLKQIAEFLNGGGFFPNSIILNFKQRVRFDALKPENEDGVTSGTLVLPNTYKSAWIIDGQHRIYGYAEMDQKKPPLLPFIAFENIDITEETKLFTEINSKQKRVEKRLLDELTGEIKLESADRKEQMRAIGSRVFDIMRDDDDGPLGGKITGAELKQSDQSVLTIPYLVDAVNQGSLLGRVVTKDGKNVFMQGPLHWEKPREAIDTLLEFLTEYLGLFRNANLERWETGKTGRIAFNPGVAGIIRLAADLIDFMEKKDKEDPRHLHPKVLAEKIEVYAQPCLDYIRTASEPDIERRFTIPFGSGGPRIFLHRLRELIFHQFADFDPPGFKDDLRRYDAERTQRGDKMVRAIQRDVQGFIISRLKEEYGNDDNYLERAVDNRELLKKAYEKRIEDDEAARKDQGTYFDFLDLRKIVETPKNWPHFSGKLDIVMPANKNKQKNVYWFDVINKTRRVPAHPYNRSYSDEDYNALDFVYKRLMERGVILDDRE